MSRSESLFQKAQAVIPGGVNSPVRAFTGVGGTPVFFKSARGAYVYDEDDRQYIDYVASWGPMILGHAHTEVISAVRQKAGEGLSFGAPTTVETELAERVVDLIPSMDMVRFVSSGTEATMSAIRLARGYTGRDKVIKFEGCYHGHSDSLLVKAGSGALTLGVPTSPGVPASLAGLTLTLTFNDTEQLAEAFEQYGEQLACVIIEPVAGNMSCIPPLPGFLEELRQLCDQYDTVLIFDEVMTGFRISAGGAQSHYGITPDMTTLGKIIGGGLPVGAFGGRHEIMRHIAPLGPVYQAGTLSGCPIAMAAGLKTLELINQEGFYQSLEYKTEKLARGIIEAARQADIPMTENHVGGMFGLFFTSAESVTDFAGVTDCDQERFKKFFHGMLEAGVYLAPSAFEAGFMSAVHTHEDIQTTIDVAAEVLKKL